MIIKLLMLISFSADKLLLMNFSIVILVFGVVFLAELPDKSMFASLALSTRYRKLYVWMGAAAAFLVHVIIAVTAGRALRLLPKQTIEIILALLFGVSAGLLLFGKNEDEKELVDPDAAKAKKLSHSFLKVFSTSFLVVFLGEWGDITQIVTANYAAKYHSVISVGVGAVLGLWTVAAFGIIVGSKVLEKIPARIVQRLTGTIMLIFAVLSAVAAIKN